MNSVSICYPKWVEPFGLALEDMCYLKAKGENLPPTIKKHPFLFSMILFFAVIYAGKSTLHYSGFCMAEKRWISDGEVIRKQVERLASLQTLQMYIPGKGEKIYTVVPYASADEFMKKNPDCCRMGEFGGEFLPRRFRAQINGDFRETMGVHYTVNYLDENGKKASHFRDYYFTVDNCGQLPDWETYNEKYVME